MHYSRVTRPLTRRSCDRGDLGGWAWRPWKDTGWAYPFVANLATSSGAMVAAMRPKNPLVLCLFVAFLVARPLCVAASPDSSPTIVIDGTRLSSDVPALVSGDHVLVPLRGVFEQFGALVSFDETTGWATASLNGTTVAVAVGSATRG